MFEKADQKQQKPVWQSTSYANLVRYIPSGKYFSHMKVGGKLIRRSLKTKSITVAKLRLLDLQKEERQKAAHVTAASNRVMTFGDALKIFRQRLQADPSLKPCSKEYREEGIAAMLKSWTGLESIDVRTISKADCLNWAASYATKVAASNYNNTVGTLGLILDIAVETGSRYDNPARFIKRVPVKQKPLLLPSQAEFAKLVECIANVNKRYSKDCAILVQFLAFSGCRISEAARVTWADCDFDFEKGRILVLGDPETGTKNGEFRYVPMIPDMRRLLESLRAARPEAQLSDHVMKVHECQRAIDSACKKLGIPRFTHHNLRHLFATRCIESRVDIPTVSRWLGHKDGGALAMKTYGHLRDQHSTSMAQLVTFSQSEPENVVPLKQTTLN
jgi:integrase